MRTAPFHLRPLAISSAGNLAATRALARERCELSHELKREQELGTYEVKLRLPSGDELPIKVNIVKR